MNNYVLKLVTGESVFCKIEALPEEKMLIVSDALTWEEFFGEDGYPVTSLVRYCSGSDEKQVPISKAHIVSMAKMSDEFSAFYEAAVAMSDITQRAYTSKLGSMTARMYDKIQAYHAMNHQKKTGELVAYFTAGSESDSDTIH